MKLILRYIKPYALLVLLCFALLFGQAYCDLSLPNLMSDIVNTGIQLGGVPAGAPAALSEDAAALMERFMDGEGAAAFQSAYTPETAPTEEYPAGGRYLVRKEDPASLAAADTAYGNAAYAFMLYLKDQMAGSGTAPSGDEGVTDQVDLSQLYALIPMLQQLPDETFAPYLEAAGKTDASFSTQVGATFSRLFLEELGVDTGRLQMRYILKTGLVMLLIALLGVAAAVAVGYVASRVSAAVTRQLRRDVFEKVSGFSSAEFDRFSTASLITRTTNDIQQVQMLLVMGLRMMCYAPIMGIGGVVMALRKSTALSWTIALAVVALLGLVLVIFALALPKFKSLQTLVDRLNLVSRENLSGMLVIRAFGNEAHEEKRFEGANGDLAFTQRYVQRVMAFMMPAMMLIMNGISLVIVWVGAHAIEASTLQIGDMMAFIQYAMQIIMAFLMIAMMFIMVPRALVSAVRIGEVLSCEPSIRDPRQPKALAGVRGEVSFDHVSFRYENAEEDVLSDITFTARPGETTAFIGSTGSGKSTLINLIPRFYDVTAGAVRVDGVDVRDVAQKELRSHIGYVPQKGVLFSGDIASNLRYGKEDAPDEALRAAVATAQAEDFVDSLEEGLHAEIAQGGDNVSGGQKQRLSIARALARRPEIYIFDDSFSALDFKTDAALRRALRRDTAQATVLIVAQRVSTILGAEQIIVLDQGRMVGRGTHRELLKACPTYREIAESQLSKEELE